MKLHSIKFVEYEGEQYAWTLDVPSLIDINLIVGKNATGKSRLLRLVNNLARLIEGTLLPTVITSGRYEVVFKERDTRKRPQKPDMTYTVEIHDKKVKQEILKVGDLIKLRRGTGGRGTIYFEKSAMDIDVQIPEENVASATRRDSQQHGFLEELHEWASSVRYYESAKSDASPHVSAFSSANISFDVVNKLPLQNNLHLVIMAAHRKFGIDFQRAVKTDMRKIGYLIEDFGLMPFDGIVNPLLTQGGFQTLFVVEQGIDKKMPQHELSNGMFRALSTLIFLHFIMLQKDYGCFLIDDIGEGLDFDRASKLISVIIDRTKNGFLQLLMTTNDRFVMNGVPLTYWTVMDRIAGKVNVYNERNSKESFEEFDEFGFNNFDFFSKGFFSNGVSTVNKK